MKILPVVPALVMLCVCTVDAQQSMEKDSKPRTVSVQGQGKVTATPDQVRITVQVNTRGESASSAMNMASGRTREILGLLKNLGVSDKDIQTSRVTVTAILDYEKRIQPPPIVGYTGSNDFSVLFKGKLMEKVGEFLDKAVTAGASSFSGLMYEASNSRELEREALKKAALDAKARAEVLAKELGVSVGQVLSISESVTTPVPFQRGMMAMTDASSSAPVMSGELTITATTSVVFELK